jgi:hypothetical protein
VPTGCWLLISLVLTTRSQAAQTLPPDLVALTGRHLPKLIAVAPKEIVAVAERDGALLPVHVQIDQRFRADDRTAHFAFEAGDDRRPPHDGLGPDDLVLLALPEGGERLQVVPDDYTEIEVTDPSGGITRWFYLYRGALLLPPPLLRYDAAADRITGQDYAIGFSHQGTAVIDSLVLGDPADATNLIERSKARLDVDLALGIGSVHRSEDDVHVRATGLHVGPLRIIREAEVRGRMLLGLYSPPVRDNFIFYPHGFVLPTTIRLTPTARMIVRAVTLRISMDLTEAARGMTFQSEPEMPKPTVINGRGGMHGGSRPIGWYLLRRGTIGLLGWLQARPDIARDVTLYYRDDEAHSDAPEALAGEVGDHGFLFHHSGPLPSGEARLSSHAWILHGEQLDNPAAVLRTFGARPKVQVH